MADLDRESVRGREAEHLLNNPMLKDAFDYLEQVYTDAWKNGNDPEQWVKCRYKIASIRDVRAHLETVMTTGRLADNQIAEMVRREKQRKKYA